MNEVVIFTSNNARIVKEPPGFDRSKYAGKYLVNPNLDRVKGLPPHYWKVIRDEIHPMTSSEKADRDINHRLSGVDNKIYMTESLMSPVSPVVVFFEKHKAPILTAVGAAVGAILGKIIL